MGVIHEGRQHVLNQEHVVVLLAEQISNDSLDFSTIYFLAGVELPLYIVVIAVTLS